MRRCFLIFTGLLLSLKLSIVDAGCTLPDITGLWWDSRVGTTVQFQGIDVINSWNITINSQAIVSYKCVERDETRLAFKSDQSITLQFGVSAYYAVYCYEYTQLTDYSFSYYVLADVEGNTNSRVLLVDETTANTYSSIADYCNPSGGHPDIREFHVLVKNEHHQKANIGQYLPDTLLAIFPYTVDDGSGIVSCSSGSMMDGCYVNQYLERTQVILNYTLCSVKLMSSTSGQLYNVANISDSSTDYLMLMTIDGTTIYFTCIAVSQTGSNRYISTKPGGCSASQVSTSRVNCDGCLLLTSTSQFDECLFTTTTSTTTTTTTTPTTTTTATQTTTITSVRVSNSSGGNNIGAIIGVVLPLLLIIIIIVACLCYRKFFRWRKLKIQEPLSKRNKSGMDIKMPLPPDSDFGISGLNSKSTENLVENDTMVEVFRSNVYDVEAYAGNAGPIPEKPKAPPVFLFTRTPTAIISKMTRNPKQSSNAMNINLAPLPKKPTQTTESTIEESSDFKPLPPISGNWMSD